MSKIDRIRKLLNLADNAGAADGEADNARRIAATMMEAEGITEADIAGAVGDGPPPWETVVNEFVQGRRPGQKLMSWQWTIYYAIGRLTGVYLYRSRSLEVDSYGALTLNVIGTREARETFHELTAWAFRQIERLAVNAARIYNGDRTKISSYRFGIAEAIAGQVLAMVKARPAPAAGSPGLVVLDRVAQAIEAAKPPGLRRSSKVRRYQITSAFMAGQAAGRTVEVQRRAAAPAGQRTLGGSR